MSTREESIIGVIGGTGARKLAPNTLKLAEAVGRELTQRDRIVLTGGRPDAQETSVKQTVMQSALAAADGKHIGRVIGILPKGKALFETSANHPRYGLYVHTGLEGYERNLLNGVTPDALIALQGGAGTLSELAFACFFEVPVVFLDSLAPLRQVLANEVVEARRAISMGCSAYERIRGNTINCDSVFASLGNCLGRNDVKEVSDTQSAVDAAIPLATALRGQFLGLVGSITAVDEFDALVKIMGKTPNPKPQADA